ncbi:MAG: hypothetical protein V3W37_04835, partial [Candidatus Binatia bacterium]
KDWRWKVTSKQNAEEQNSDKQQQAVENGKSVKTIIAQHTSAGQTLWNEPRAIEHRHLTFSPIAKQRISLDAPTTRALHAHRPTRDSVRHHAGERYIVD